VSSGPVIIDPNELRQFANQLKRFNADLASNFSQLQAQFRQLGETWRDPAYAKFAQEFEQTMKNLQRFRQVSDEVVPRLIRTADRADAVHNH
jgi:WXG100 family type VII secretion target